MSLLLDVTVYCVYKCQLNEPRFARNSCVVSNTEHNIVNSNQLQQPTELSFKQKHTCYVKQGTWRILYILTTLVNSKELLSNSAVVNTKFNSKNKVKE